MNDDKLIRLNVGGKWFSTSRHTLLSFPDTVLARLALNAECEKQGYYFIDRDGTLFEYVLNFMRSKNSLLPTNEEERRKLAFDAKFYGLQELYEKLTSCRKRLVLEVIELAHPEKIGCCGARLVLNEEIRQVEPFTSGLARVVEEYEGQNGRGWVRTKKTRLDWAQLLYEFNWKFDGSTTITRRLPDVTGGETDLCHVIDRWHKIVSD